YTAASATARRSPGGGAGCSRSGISWTAVVAAATTASLTRVVPAGAGLGRTSANPQIPALRLALGDLAAHYLPVVGGPALRLPGHPLADRVQDGQALADQPGGDLAQAVGAVEHAHVGPGQPGRGLLDDERQLVDQQLVERDAVVRGGRLGLDPGALGVRQGEDPDPFGLGL